VKAFTVLFLAHLLGDFYFQPQKLAERKEGSFGFLMLHCAIYAAAAAASLLLLGGGFIIAAVIAAVSHLVIDCVKFAALKSTAKAGVLTVSGDRAAFCIDQALHLAAILAASLLVTAREQPLIPPYMEGFGSLTGVDPYRLVAYAALALGVLKPANVFIRRMMYARKPDEEPTLAESESVRSGRYIGGLERLLMITLMALKQYGSIAIVFTAKSIARFRRLDDREYAEYYIFGTLLSAVTAAGMFLLLKLFGTLY
jgi:hypothetical protein